MPRKQATSARDAREGERRTVPQDRLSPMAEVRAGEEQEHLQVEFTGEIFQWRGPAPYYFVTVPAKQALELKAVSSEISYYRGMIRVQARIGETEWKTSLWPKDGRYVVPVKDLVRKPMGLADGDAVTIHLRVASPAAKKQDDVSAPSDRSGGKERPAAGRRRARGGGDRRIRRGGVGAAGSRRRPQVTDDQLRIVPANLATWEDLQAVFGQRGASSVCWCQRYKMQPKERCISTVGAKELAPRLRKQTACGQPEAAVTTGLVAYVDGEPAGWCAVDPRSANPRLLSQCRAPWDGRSEDKTDDTVWAVTCILTRAGFRRRGISRALARAAVDFARQRGARALEAYPHTSEVGHFGTPGVFAAAGFVEVSRSTPRRIVMRIDF